jgi:hypothetical protein
MKTLHPDAAAALNAIADTISLDKPPKSLPGSGPIWGQQHISSAVTQKDIIGTPRLVVTNGLGEKEGIFTEVRAEKVSITGNSLLNLSTVVRRVLGISSLSDLLSEEYVENLAIDWCFAEPTTRSSFAEFLMGRAEQDVSCHQIWIPTAYFQVEEDFEFGPSQIVTIPRSLFDQADERAKIEQPEHEKEILEAFGTMRKRFQGNAAVALSIEGEKLFAKKKAQIVAQDVIGLLRFFHPAVFSWKHFCPCALFGSEFMPLEYSFIIEGPGRFEYTSSVVHSDTPDWRLSRRELKQIQSGQLPIVAGLVSTDGISDLALTVRSSILTYCRGMTFPDMSDRLVYSLSALESLLLKNTAEFIQQNLSERIAFLTASGAADRMKVVASCKKIYTARSQYIHHRRKDAVPEDDLALFFIMAHRALQTALGNLSKFKTTSEFIDAIDRMKFS